jgi:hypothetical protein
LLFSSAVSRPPRLPLHSPPPPHPAVQRVHRRRLSPRARPLDPGARVGGPIRRRRIHVRADRYGHSDHAASPKPLDAKKAVLVRNLPFNRPAAEYVPALVKCAHTRGSSPIARCKRGHAFEMERMERANREGRGVEAVSTKHCKEQRLMCSLQLWCRETIASSGFVPGLVSIVLG